MTFDPVPPEVVAAAKTAFGVVPPPPEGFVQVGWQPYHDREGYGTSLYPMDRRPSGVMDDDGCWHPATCLWAPVYRKIDA